MTLGTKLLLVFLAFLAVLTVVIGMAFRERKRAREIPEGDFAAQQAADGRVLFTVFTAIIGGMLLTLLTAWLVFF
jgi:Na+-transporting methylmalonyl-CoA/oxaloacetate decarboxylase gamma subunit